MTTRELMDSHGQWLRGLARALLRDHAVRDDMEQSLWESTIRHPPRPEGSVRGWLGRILLNRIRNDHREERRRRARESVVAAEMAEARAPSPEEMAEMAEMQRRILAIVDGLDERFRQVIHLRYFEGLEPRASWPPGSPPAGASWTPAIGRRTSSPGAPRTRRPSNGPSRSTRPP